MDGFEKSTASALPHTDTANLSLRSFLLDVAVLPHQFVLKLSLNPFHILLSQRPKPVEIHHGKPLGLTYCLIPRQLQVPKKSLRILL
jgi:hypothetical protein